MSTVDFASVFNYKGCVQHNVLGLNSHCAFFSKCDFDFSYRIKWVAQRLMEVFTTNSSYKS